MLSDAVMIAFSQKNQPVSLGRMLLGTMCYTTSSHWMSQIGSRYMQIQTPHASLYGTMRGLIDQPISKALDKFWTQGSESPAKQRFFLKTIFVALNFFLVSGATYGSLTYLKGVPVSLGQYKNYMYLEAGNCLFGFAASFAIKHADPQFARLKAAISG